MGIDPAYASKANSDDTEANIDATVIFMFCYLISVLFSERGKPIEKTMLALFDEYLVKLATPMPKLMGFLKGLKPAENAKFMPVHSAFMLTCLIASNEILPNIAVPWVPFPLAISMGLFL